ncbi:MAG: DUF2309 domain-containing protein [Pseudomonadota bacterium]
MTTAQQTGLLDTAVLEQAADAAARQIPPVFPLAASVAVNPFLGQTTGTLAEAGARLARIGGVPVTMPRRWYQTKIATGEITDADLQTALDRVAHDGGPADLDALKSAAKTAAPDRAVIPTVADLAGEASGTNWTGLIDERFGAWAAGYFDDGQALWAAPKGRSAWDAFRIHATHDLTPEIMGLRRFSAFVAEAPERASEAIARASIRLGLWPEGIESYFHQLLFTLGGWAQYARYELWQAELAGHGDATITDFLAIRLLWEEALYDQYGPEIDDRWAAAKLAHAGPAVPDADATTDTILQHATEIAAQRGLAETLAAPSEATGDDRPTLQAAFCIDVRSEVFRRALESVDSGIRTLGFAGFFGVFAEHKGFASDVAERRLPVLLNPTVTSASGNAEAEEADTEARYTARAKRAWGRFKLAAVSSFAFVEAMGPVYAAKLARDALALHADAAKEEPKPEFSPALDAEARLGAAETVLRAMSLTSDFARVVVLAGHGANVTNNPFESGLHCGACGGYSGEVNARLLASLLNDADVRTGLFDKGIEIPADTLFIGALHDTTTDAMTLYDADHPVGDHAADLKQARTWFAAAGRITRGERALRLPRATDEAAVSERAHDWAEVRPEWALAGCKAFIAAPRPRTTGRTLEGRAFLHDYDWRQDEPNGFGVLELIMTAPVVVASWISLQYYGSTVAPQAFGGGNKLLHNVVGGIGVVEGNGGPLRAGLPWQSVHDGERYIHEPLRLSVCIEAPVAAMTDILSRHEGVRVLFDNGWLHLFALDEDGRMAQRYCGGLQWEVVGEVEALQVA